MQYTQAVIQPKSLLGSVMSAAAMLALVWASGAAWQAYARSKLHPVIFESSSGEWLTVNASDASKQITRNIHGPSDEVLLPAEEVRLDVSASQRLSYSQTITPAPANIFNKVKSIYLDAPQSHRWLVDNILWHESLNIVREGKPTHCCLALRGDHARFA